MIFKNENATTVEREGILSQTLITHSERETLEAASNFARRLKRGDLIALSGELGSGKTQFVKGVCLGLGVKEHVTSPSFTILNEYKGFLTRGKDLILIFHFDFYRVSSLEEIYDLGFEEYFYDDGICLIEWAERAEPLLPERYYKVQLKILDGEHQREIRIAEVRCVK